MTKPPTCSLDAIRLAYPHLGLAVYAFEPGGAVTLEVHAADGQVFSFTGPTEQAVLLRAFPPDVIEPAPEPPPPPTQNVFD